MKGRDTYTLAYDCCDQVLFEDGKFPTIDAIRARIGVNSPATITKAIKDWTLHFVDKHQKKLLNPKMPTQLADAAESLWILALNEAAKSFEKNKAAFELRDAERQTQFAELENLLKTQEIAWGAEKQRFITEIAAQTQLLQEFSSRLEETAMCLNQTETALHETRQSFARSEGALVEARTASEKQAQDWESKFEKDHLWHLKRIAEEKELLNAQFVKALADKERALELSRMSQESLTARLTQIMNKVGDSLERQTQLEAELEYARLSLIAKEEELQKEKQTTEKLRALVKRQRRPDDHVQQSSDAA